MWEKCALGFVYNEINITFPLRIYHVLGGLSRFGRSITFWAIFRRSSGLLLDASSLLRGWAAPRLGCSAAGLLRGWAAPRLGCSAPRAAAEELGIQDGKSQRLQRAG